MNKNLRILSIDDSPVMRYITKRYFDNLGFANTTLANDGNSGLALLLQEPFDLVVTDWSMPGMSGIDLLRAIRADAMLKHLPVVMVTGEATREQAMEAEQAGVNGFVTKPFTEATLQANISRIFNAEAIAA